MAPFKNLFGEVSPDQTRVSVQVRTHEGVATIQRVDAENSDLQMTQIDVSGVLNSMLVTPGAQALNYLSPNIDKQPANFDAAIAVNRIPHEVVFLDVGRWGGRTSLAVRQRNFGLIWGTWVALCDFEPSTPALDTDEHLLRDDAGVPRVDHPINDFIRNVRKAGASIRLLRSMYSGNPNFLKGWTQDWTTLYVVLPDLHLPVCTNKPPAPDGNHMGRHNYRQFFSSGVALFDDEGCKPTTPKQYGGGAEAWFSNYFAGDIFGGPNSPAALELDQFLNIIEGMTLPNGRTVHFVQIGDMYDYWIGLERFFSAQPTHSVVLANGTGGNSGILAGKFIDFWADRTHLALQSPSGTNVVERLNRMPGKVTSSFLWGNHDNYLAAHTPVVSVGAPVPPRIREIRRGGVLIEHGQRGDPDNRDGATSGHSTTNDVFEHPVMRSLDPNRRNFYTALAGVSYVAKPDFHIFCMGHTHSPYLTRVRIEVVLTR
jgi:hypothetical protein